MRHQEPHRAAMLRRERLAVVREGQQVRRPVEVGEREVGGEVLLRVDEDERAAGPHARALEDRLHRYALEHVVVPAPARDAVHVAHRLAPGNRMELVPGEGEWARHRAAHLESPGARSTEGTVP